MRFINFHPFSPDWLSLLLAERAIVGTLRISWLYGGNIAEKVIACLELVGDIAGGSFCLELVGDIAGEAPPRIS